MALGIKYKAEKDKETGSPDATVLGPSGVHHPTSALEDLSPHLSIRMAKIKALIDWESLGLGVCVCVGRLLTGCKLGPMRIKGRK